MSLVAAAIAGVVFALGLVISGMTDPANVLAFLDVGGDWNPALGFVMAGAIALYAPIAWLVTRRDRPVFDSRFVLPQDRSIDATLVGGAAVFGVGWGLSGYCPGPVLVSLTTGVHAVVFVAAMLGGILAARWLAARRAAR